LAPDIPFVNQFSQSQSDRDPADTIELLKLLFGGDRLARIIFSAHDLIADRFAQLID
jgi:hypothetical protein